MTKQRIDVGEHSLGGVVGLRLRFRDHGGDHIADEPHTLTGEDRPVEGGRQHRRHPAWRDPQVVAGVEHGNHSPASTCLADVDRVDLPWATLDRTSAT